MRWGPWWIGLSLASLQLVLLSALAPAFRSGELALQLLSIAVLAGHALGYRLGSGPAQALSVLAGLSGPVALALRAGGGELATVAAGCLWALLSSAGLAHGTVAWWNRHRQLAPLYSSEMLGAACALGLAWLVGARAVLLALPFLLAAALQGNRRGRGAALLVVLGLVQFAYLDGLEDAARRHDLSRSLQRPARVLEAAYSPYQLIEVVEAGSERTLFLNGLCHHDPRELQALDQLLAGVPARLAGPELRERGALVLGAGALSSVQATRAQGWPTTVVELDARVLDLSRRYFAPHLSRDPQVRWVADDARAFLHQAPDYGLIVFSLPYPYALNAASLFTREYFQELDRHLHPDGCLALYLGTPIRRRQLDPVAGAFLRAARQVWPQALAVSSQDAGNTVVYLSRTAVPAPGAVQSQLLSLGQSRFRFYSAPELDRMIGFYPAASLWDLRFCARLNLDLWKNP